jgi:hypothetical protein
VYVAPSSSFNDAVTGTVIDPDAWNTLLADLETALNFGTTGATDNRLLRSDGTGGLTLQSSAITVDDSGNMSGVGTLAAGVITATLTGCTGLPSILVADTTDSTCFVGLFESATGELAPKTDGALLYNASTGALTATSFVGSFTGNADTVTWADEASDTTCFIGFATAASGSLAPKTNTNMTFNSSTGVATFASTVLTTTDINGGTLDGTIIGGSSAAAGSFTTITASSNISITSSDPVISITDTDTSALNRISGNNATGSLYLFADIGAAVANSVILFNVDNADRVQVSSSATSPTSNDGNALGTTSLGWADLHGATGFTWNIANGDWLATHTTGILTVGTGDLRVTTAGTNTASVVTVGGTQTLTNKTLTSPVINAATFGTSVLPSSDGAVDLGSTTAAWNNLHLDTGATINVENGNAVITHSSGIFTVSTGDWRITTAGTNSASAVTVGGTQTLTAKTLTSPTITTSPTAAGATWTDLGTVTTADINGGTLDGVTIGGASAAAITGTTITVNTSLLPDANDGAVLGATGTRFSDLFLADGGVVDFGASGSRATITHTAASDSITIAADPDNATASSQIIFSIDGSNELILDGTSLTPGSDGGNSLGTTALGWQNLFANTGFVLNIENSNWVATHTSGILTVGTGDLRVTTAGTNTASVVTVGGTQTLTAKTLTSPVIGTSPTAAGATWTDLGTVTTADINGGTLDGTVIGGASAAAATATALTATQNFFLTGDISPTALSGDVDNYDPTGNSTASVIRIDGGAANRNITGLVGGSDGKIKVILNIGATNNLVLKNDTTSTAGNRFLFGADITLTPDQGGTLWYDSTDSRWKCIGVFTASGGGGSGTVTSVATDSSMYGGTITSSGTLGVAVPCEPGGRLTVASGSPVVTATDSGNTTIYYAFYKHNFVPIYDGTRFVMTAFTELSQATTDNTKSPAAVANNSNYDMFVWNDSGTVRCTRGPAWTSDTGRGTGAGTTELERVNGTLVNKIAITNGPAAQRGTYVGSVRSNGSAQIDWTYGSKAAGGGAATFGVWNLYNRVLVATSVEDSTDSWSYPTATWRGANNSATMRASFISGLAEDSFAASYVGFAQSSANVAINGVGLDSTSSPSGTGIAGYPVNIILGTPALMTSTALGFHYVQALETADTSGGTMLFYGDQGGVNFQHSLRLTFYM